MCLTAADNTSLPQKIRALEYRLSTQLQKYNAAVAENKSMRERIDALRKERVVFDVIYRQLEYDILSKREELIASMSRADKAQGARDELRAQLEQTQADFDKIKEHYSQEWNEVVEKSLMLQNQGTDEHTRHSGTQASTHREDRTGPTHAEKLRSTVARAAWGIARDTGYIHVGLQKVQQYEEALATIKEAIGQNITLNEIVERFQQTESQNFSLYNYVSELNTESEQLGEEIRDLEGKIDRHRNYGIGNASQNDFAQRRQQLEDIMSEVDRT